MPGLANGGISARSYIRGGESNETLFLLDGLRLYEPFHLKDFQAVATTVNSNAISRMDFYAGAFPARYGDRMSGVIEMYLREPEKDMRTELALSFFNASLLLLGNFGSAGQGDWLVAARRGNLDLIVDLVDPDIDNSRNGTVDMPGIVIGALDDQRDFHAFASGIDLDVSLFRKSFRATRPRYENALAGICMDVLEHD